MNRASRFWALITAIALIGFFTLGPASPAPWATERECCALTDVALNMLLFVPLGTALVLVGARPLVAFVIGSLYSAAIELTQQWLPGRVPSIRDIITNAAGALAGAIIVTGWPTRARWWRVVGPIGAGLVLAGSIVGSFLVRPASPRPREWVGFWAHQLGNTVPFEGRVLRFEVQGVPIPDGPLGNSEQLSSRLAGRDTVELVTTIVSGPRVEGRAQLVGLMAEAEGSYYISLWQEGRSLLGLVRLRLADLGLRTSGFRVEDALPTAPGDTVVVSVTLTSQRVVLASTWGNSRQEGRFDLSTELFWAAFLPFEVQMSTRPATWPLLALTLGFAGLGLGVRSRGVVLVAAVLALFLGPLAAGTAVPPLSAIIAAIAGIWLGRWAGFRLGLSTTSRSGAVLAG